MRRHTARWIGRTIFGVMALAASARADTFAVAITPAEASLKPLQAQQFQARVSGSKITSVVWLVNGVVGGTPTTGFIQPSGLYTAPADVAAAVQVEIEAQPDAQPLIFGHATASLAASPPPARQFHVSTTGNDANPGSAAKPWRTLQHAVATVPAGSAIEVATGIYNELVTLTRSGAAKAGFITLEAAAGASPVIDGTGRPIPNGENGLVTIQDASFVRVRGFELRNYVSHSASADPVGILVEGAGSHIELTDNHVHDVTTTVKTSAGDALGIAVYGTRAPAALHDIVIAGNELDHLTTGFSESLAISGNVEGWQVSGNLIHDNDNIGIDIGGFEGFAPSPAYDRARQGEVAGNIVYDISSLHNPAYQGQQSADGIYVDGGTDVVIERNLIHATDLGIEVASEHAGRTSSDVTVRSNLVHHSNVVGISIGGYAVGVGGTAGCTIVNNTLVDDDTSRSGTGELQIQYHASGNSFRNNIAAANAQGLMMYAFVPTVPAPAILSSNRYDSPLGAAGSQFTWQNRTYTGFATYRKKTGNDPGSSFGAPGFADAAASDFRLAAGSPAIGTGMRLPLSEIGLYDFAGAPRTTGGRLDQGAYQD